MLTTLFLLVLAIGMATLGGRWPIAAALAVVLAAWAGTTFPDIDQTLPLDHRSALTHSIIPAAVATAKRRWWAVAAGLALGIGLHLSADLFPNGMRGFATVKLPVYGSIGASASYLWFAVNAAGALLLGGWLLGQIVGPKLALAAFAVTALLGVVYLFITDGGWWALTMFGGAGTLAVRSRRPV